MVLRVACQEILDGMEANCEVRTVRGWKLLLVLPRMMLFRSDREDLCPGRSSRPESGNSRKASGSHFCVRVLLVQRQHTVPVSDVVAAARQALEGASLAPGNLATLGMLTDPTRRPPVPRSALSHEVRDTEPAEPVALDPLEFLTCLRKARRGAAVGAVRDDFRSPLPDVGE